MCDSIYSKSFDGTILQNERSYRDSESAFSHGTGRCIHEVPCHCTKFKFKQILMSTVTATVMATTTVSTAGALPQKLSSTTSKGSVSMEATLQSLYNRATRAFLHRDVAVTFTLLKSAFELLLPPPMPSPEPLDAHRRKWDILRITLETTVFSSAPDFAALPQSLRESLLLSPQLFISTLYARSLTLFTPSSLPRKPSSAFLPHQILVTLVASSLKVDCPNFGREIIEDWLSKRGQYDFIPSTGEPYHKVLELYCLHVLPRLGEWVYIREFLSCENELASDKRRVSLFYLYDCYVVLTVVLSGTLFGDRGFACSSAGEHKATNAET
jgi:hypothetical protein